MGIFDTIAGLFNGQTQVYDPKQFQRDVMNLQWAMDDLNGTAYHNGGAGGPIARGAAGMSDPFSAISHIFGAGLNSAAGDLLYGTSSPDARLGQNVQPFTPDLMLGPGGVVQTHGNSPYATQENAKKAKDQGQPSLQGQETPTFAAPNQWLGQVREPIPGQGQSQVVQQPGKGAPGVVNYQSTSPQGSGGGQPGASGGNFGPNPIDPTVAQFLAETGASLNPASAPSAAPTAEPAPADTAASAPNSQAMAQMILSGASYTDPATGQVHDFSQMDDAQKMQLLTALFGGQAPTGATDTQDTGYVGP